LRQMDLDLDARAKGFLAFGYLLCLVAALACGLFAGAFVYNRLGPAGEYVRSAVLQRVGGGPPPFGGKDRAYILIMGIDERRNDPGRADTVMVACVDVPDSGIRVLSIPRDTRVRIAGTSRYDKVNAAMHYGGVEAARETVSSFLGVPIDYYALTNLEGFRTVVDLVGGVDLDVEKRMRYRDRRGGLTIDLDPGLQHLDGDKAMQYVRFRHDAQGDISRVRRQQKFLRAVSRRMFEMSNWPRLPSIVTEMLKAVQTDLSPDDVVWMARLAKNLCDEKIRCATVPGYGDMIGGASQWIPDTEKLGILTEQLFEHGVVPRLDAVTVEILNASGTRGAATKASKLLRSRGFRITSCRDAGTQNTNTTRVLDHRGWTEVASQVCSLLGCGHQERALDETESADLTVYVGADFSTSDQDGR
jgi:LCP family protein required for cell wall assembly